MRIELLLRPYNAFHLDSPMTLPNFTGRFVFLNEIRERRGEKRWIPTIFISDEDKKILLF